MYFDHCIDRLKKNTMSSKPTALEKEHVYEVYDQIASHFSQTRHSKWTSVREFLEQVPANSLVLDLGCGNGKYLDFFKEKKVAMIGCDRCEELLKICRRRGFEVALVDGLFLPYRRNMFDYVICVAVLHHLSTNSLRRRFLLSLVNVLRPGGQAMIVVWALERESIKKEKESRQFTHVGDEAMVGWTRPMEDGGEVRYERYYHLFACGELEWLCSTVEGIRVKEIKYDHDNWYGVIEKCFIVCWKSCHALPGNIDCYMLRKRAKRGSHEFGASPIQFRCSQYRNS